MKHILICTLLLTFFVGLSQTQPNKSTLISSNQDETVLTFTFSQYDLKSVKTPQGTQQIVVAKNLSAIMQKGTPDLPKYSESIIISDTKNTKIEVLSSQFVEIQNVAIAPSKGNFSRTILPKDVPFEYGKSYNENAFFPKEIATLDAPYIMRDFRAQVVQVYPFNYNPKTKVLRVYSEIKLRIYSDTQNGDNSFERTKPLEIIDADFDEIYSNQFINYTNRDTNASPLLENGKMLIICHDAWMPQMAAFLEWKNSIGRPTELVSVTTAGLTAAGIRQYVANYYATKGLTYLLLVGDAEQVPSNTAGLLSGIQIGGDSDNAYAYLTGIDHYQEFFVGRFSAQTAEDVTTQAQRTIDYEKGNQLATGWLNKVVSIASQEGPGDDNEIDFQHLRNIQTDLLGFTYDNPVYEFFEGSQGGYDGEGNPNASNVSSALNNGAGIINYVGHGSDTSWATSNFSGTDAENLLNNNKLPFIFDVACVNGNFVGQTTFAENWMRSQDNNQPTGAIAICASTINQSWSPPMVGQDEMNDILVGTAATGSKKTFAGIVINGCYKMNDETSDFAMTDTWTCFGDPSLLVRTDDPTGMIVDHTMTVINSSNSFEVNCNFNGAVATISSNGQIIGTTIVANNIANIPLVGLTPSQNLKLVVIGFNKVYYTSNLTVISATGSFLAVNALDNYFINFGQTKNINLKLANVGLQNATNANVTAVCNDSNATFTNANFAFGSIGASQVTAYSQNAFTLQVANNLADQYPVTIEFRINDTTNIVRTEQKTILVNAPKLNIENLTINDAVTGNNNSFLDPGESAIIKVEVKNNGHAPITNTSASLLSSLIGLSITSQQLSYTIATNGNHIFTFNVQVASNVVVGTLVTLNFKVLGGVANQYTDTKNFSLPIGYIATYCDGGADLATDEYISNVTFAGINNSSTRATSYTNFTNIIATISRSSSYPIIITNGSHYTGDQMGCWIDWNYDGDFNDANETFDVNYQNGIGSSTIIVPNNARLGTTRLRTRVLYTNSILSCGNSSFGEVEDYTVNVTANLATNNLVDLSGIQIYPNPSNGNFEVMVHEYSSDEKNSISIYTLNGTLVYNQVGILKENQIKLNVSSGIYFLTVIQDGTIKNSKLIIK